MGHGARVGFGGNDSEAKQHLDWAIAHLRTLPYTFELADPPRCLARWAGRRRSSHFMREAQGAR